MVARVAAVAMVGAVTLAGCTSDSGGPPPPASTTGPTPGATEQYTPVVMRVMSQPHWFTGTDSAVHLVYELELTYAFPIPVTVTAISVRDQGRNTELDALSGDALRASMTAMSTPTQPGTELPASSVGVAWMDVRLADPASIPSRIEHTLTVSVPPGLPVPSTITLRRARPRAMAMSCRSAMPPSW